MKALNIRRSLIPGRLLFKEQDIFRKSSVRNCHVLIPLHIITSWYLSHETRVMAVQPSVSFQAGNTTKANGIFDYQVRYSHLTTID